MRRKRWVFFVDSNLNSWALPLYVRRVIITGMSFMFHVQVLCFNFTIGLNDKEYWDKWYGGTE